MTKKEYSLIHTWMAHHYLSEKTQCEQCGKKKDLQFALKHGLTYAKKRENYLILCKDCHWAYDVKNKCEVCGERCRKNLCGYHLGLKRALTKSVLIPCHYCGIIMATRYKNKKFCSSTCRVSAFYERNMLNPSEYVNNPNRSIHQK